MATRIAKFRFYDHRFGGMVLKNQKLEDLSDSQADDLDKAGLVLTEAEAKKAKSDKPADDAAAKKKAEAEAKKKAEAEAKKKAKAEADAKKKAEAEAKKKAKAEADAKKKAEAEAKKKAAASGK